MSFIVENTFTEFERVAPGLHLARCYRIIDLGTQKTDYKGQVKMSRQVMLGWEILGSDEEGKPIRMKDGRPFAIFRNYTLSWADSSNLRQSLQSWRGKPFSPEEMRKFDLKNILGAWCMLNVIDKPSKDGQKTFSNVANITPVPGMIKQSGLPPPVNEAQIFTLQAPDWAIFETFSQNLKNKIMASPEYAKAKSPASDFDDTGFKNNPVDLDDEIPF